MNSKRFVVIAFGGLIFIFISLCLSFVFGGYVTERFSNAAFNRFKKNTFNKSELPDLKGAYFFKNASRMRSLQPLDEAIWHTAKDAGYMKANDPVLGIYLDNQARALPWWIMKNYKIANLVLDDHPMLIIFSEICSSGAAFYSTINDRRHTFRAVGMFNGTILLSDIETGSYWAPFAGEALAGVLKGAQLKRLPLYQCKWSEWLALNPATLVLYGEPELREGPGKDYRPGEAGKFDKFMRTMILNPPNEALPPNELVLGIELNGKARAYPLSRLSEMGVVVNDTLAQQPIALIHQPGTTLALAHLRQIGDTVLTFAKTETENIVDQQTRSSWNYRGEAIEGQFTGEQLPFVASWIEEWYIWSAFHPQTEVYNHYE